MRIASILGAETPKHCLSIAARPVIPAGTIPAVIEALKHAKGAIPVGGTKPMLPSRGQLQDRIAFAVADLDAWEARGKPAGAGTR